MFSPSRAETGEAGVARHDVPVPPSTTSSLSGGKGNTGRQAFQQQQGNGCQVPGFPQWVPGCGAQGMQGGAHGVMTGMTGYPGGVGNAFNACAGNLAGVPNLAGNGPQPNGAGNLESDPWSAWLGNSEQANGGQAGSFGPGNPLGEASRVTSVLGPGGMAPQMAAYQQILSLLPNIGGQQMLALRQVLHDANGQVRNLPESFGGNVSQPCVGVHNLDLIRVVSFRFIMIHKVFKVVSRILL